MMRLLDVSSLQARSFELRDAPQYAILSHTWGEEEISFQDLTERANNRNKLGWKKILGFCEVCKPLGLNWVWIDTCCIDKSSSAELSEAINSMFAYYNRSNLCIAYLEDILPHYQNDNGGEVSDKAFGRSRWFTRGWTLQELIAAKRIYFCAQDWSIIGNKYSLRDSLHSITLIDTEVLKYPWMIRDCSIARRMSWASRRETTRPEDEAYCLMGIFSVNMPLLYGEGGKKAFLRLQQEILKHSTDHSLFTWTAIPDTHFEEPSDDNTFLATTGYADEGGLLAYSPREFADCGGIRVQFTKGLRDREPYDMTNVGLRIRLPTIEVDEDEHIAILDCSNDNRGVYLGIRLRHDRYTRSDGKAFERLHFHKPVNVRVEPWYIRPGGDTYTPLAQAPGDCRREVKIRMMYIRQFRGHVVG